jgi:hypothetical protein
MMMIMIMMIVVRFVLVWHGHRRCESSAAILSRREQGETIKRSGRLALRQAVGLRSRASAFTGL